MKDDISNSAAAVRDPVCGMNVNPTTATHHLEHAGKSVYFCCAPCAEKFKANPEKYLAGAARPPSSSLVALQTPASRPAPTAPVTNPGSETQTTYVCPMCPEVRASKPGPCPRCGMALEPTIPLAATRIRNTAHVPDASGNYPPRSGIVSHLRHGTGTAHRHCNRRRES